MNTSTRVSIVTGASRGLGEVIAHVLAARGYDLVIGAGSGSAQDVADSLAQKELTVRPVAGDVTDASARARLVAAARELGGLDLLVNNASELGGLGPLLEFDVQRFGRVFPVNAGAPIALIQLAVPLLAERHGLIVNITSDAATGAYAGWGPSGIRASRGVAGDAHDGIRPGAAPPVESTRSGRQPGTGRHARTVARRTRAAVPRPSKLRYEVDGPVQAAELARRCDEPGSRGNCVRDVAGNRPGGHPLPTERLGHALKRAWIPAADHQVVATVRQDVGDDFKSRLAP